MLAYQGNAYRLYDSFKKDLNQAKQYDGIKEVLGRLLPALNADAAALITEAGLGSRPEKTAEMWVGLNAQIPPSRLWPEYMELCYANKNPLSRIIRLNPHPIALSDFRRHPRLYGRAKHLRQLLGRHAMNDAFAIPLIDRQLKFSMMIIVGKDLNLRPTNRHLMTQVAADLASTLHGITKASEKVRLPCQNAPSTGLDAPQIHHKLTTRQMEIAEWLVAGKTDWEIGEILRISPKTVNFHVENIKRTYGVKSRNQFVAAIVHEGGLEPVQSIPDLNRQA